MRPITAGEEVTVSYSGSYAPVTARRADLKAGFHFDCQCSACANATAGSDERLREIQQLIDDVPSVAQTDSRRAIKMSERTLRLMALEGRDTPLDKGTIHFDAYQIASQSGDRRKATEHLRRAWECAQASEGPDSGLALQYKAMLGLK